VPISCASCGAEAREGARYCDVCGSALFQTCATCGSEQAASAAFCSTCGAALQSGVRRAEPAAEQEERRVVTVLFADLAGSTALGERIDPEDVRTLQGELFALVNSEVERFGGTSEKFVGDAVLAVFGIPQTHEDDAERAVRAALAIRQAFPSLASTVAQRHDGAEVGLRIGVNTGEVVTGRDAASRGELVVSGDAVNVAARLQQLAEPGSVLVGERTRRATRRVVSYRDAGALAAKGKELPLRAWQAVDATAEQRVRGSGQTAPLIGRDDDLELLRLTAARVARERSPQLVTIFGNAGVGKSRLVEEFVSELDAATVVVGRCVPYGDGVTYLPLAQVASSLAGILDDDRADMALAKLRASIEETVPADQASKVLEAVAWTVGLSLPGRTSGIGSAGDVQQTLHDAWARYLGALGRDELLVLVVDDIHWASAPLLDVLEHVVEALEDAAVFVVCPSRPEIVETRPSWGTGRLKISSLTLAPLGSADAENLLRALLEGGSVPPRVIRAILEPAEGNPFFVEEMLSMLLEQGVIERRNGGWVATPHLETLAVPDSIHGVIAARIDLLQASERDALRRCSVMGRVFWPSAVGVDDDLIAGLGPRAIVSEQPRSSFSGRREFAYKHALTHDVVYATLPRPERRDLHRRVAEWTADVIPDRRAETTELIAYHYEQALRYGDPDPELHRRAFEALLEAGDAAQLRGAYASAEALLTRALELIPSDNERARALLLAARVDTHRANYDRALERLDETIEAARAAGDPELCADALGVKARASWLRGHWQDSLDSAVAAVAALDGLPESAELARALARLSQIEMLRTLPSAVSTATRAIEVARRTGEGAAEVNARNNLLTAMSARGEVPSSLEWGEIVDQALAANAHDEAVRAVVNYLWSAGLLGALDPAEAFVTANWDRLTAGLTAEAYERYLQLSLAVLVYVPSGRWEEADAVVAGGEAINATNRLVYLGLVSGLALRRGDLAGTDAHLPELLESAFASQEPQRILPAVSVAMPRAIVAGDPDAVRSLADSIDVHMSNVNTWYFGTLAITRSLAAIGDRDRLARVVEARGRSLGETVPATMHKAATGSLAWLDDDSSTAARLLAEAEREAEAWGRRYDAACIALDLAQTLAWSGDAAAADAARSRAQGVLEPLGCLNPF
jgi:class 3 adenylate cyclase/tetratricopeptide (TPR) repeat protein